MRTPVCESLGIEYPIFAFRHGDDVVAAVSRAGGLGVLGAAGELLPSSHHVLMRALRCSAPKQSAYIGVSPKGSFKPDTYRY